MLKNIKKSTKSVSLPTVSLEEHNKSLHEKYPNKLKQVTPFILVTESCERLSYYSVVNNLALFGSKLGFSNSTSSVLTGLFTSWNYLSPILGAYLADTKFGRYNTIVIMSVFYAIGLALCALSAYPSFLRVDPRFSAILFYVGVFIFIATAAGGIKANVSTLGADQFNPESLTYAKDKDTFFMFFYWAINIGALIAIALFSNIAIMGAPPAIPADYGFFFVFLMATICFCLAIAVFVSGSNRFVKNQADGSVMTDTANVILKGAQKSRNGKLTIFAACCMLLTLLLCFVSVGLEGEAKVAFTFIQAALYVIAMIIIISIGKNVEWVYDVTAYPTEVIEGTAAFIRLLPLVVFLSAFNMVYSLQSSLFIFQGCQMDTLIFGGTFQVAPSTFNLLDIIAVLTMIPLCDRVLYPLWEKLTGAYPSRFGRVGLGIFFASLSVICAGAVEVFRKHSQVLNIKSICYEDQAIYLSSMSMWWQVPQYFFVGTGEVLAMVTAFDLFYSHVPANLRSLSSSLNLLSMCFGSLLCSVIIECCTLIGWIPETNNIDDGNLEYAFFFMGALGLLLLAVYVPFVSDFELWEDLSVVVVEEIDADAKGKGPAEMPTLKLDLEEGEEKQQKKEQEIVKCVVGVQPSDLIHDPTIPNFSPSCSKSQKSRKSPRSKNALKSPSRSHLKVVQWSDLQPINATAKDDMYLLHHDASHGNGNEEKSKVSVKNMDVTLMVKEDGVVEMTV